MLSFVISFNHPYHRNQLYYYCTRQKYLLAKYPDAPVQIKAKKNCKKTNFLLISLESFPNDKENEKKNIILILNSNSKSQLAADGKMQLRISGQFLTTHLNN